MHIISKKITIIIVLTVFMGIYSDASAQLKPLQTIKPFKNFTLVYPHVVPIDYAPLSLNAPGNIKKAVTDGLKFEPTRELAAGIYRGELKPENLVQSIDSQKPFDTAENLFKQHYDAKQSGEASPFDKNTPRSPTQKSPIQNANTSQQKPPLDPTEAKTDSCVLPSPGQSKKIGDMWGEKGVAKLDDGRPTDPFLEGTPNWAGIYAEDIDGNIAGKRVHPSNWRAFQEGLGVFDETDFESLTTKGKAEITPRGSNVKISTEAAKTSTSNYIDLTGNQLEMAINDDFHAVQFGSETIKPDVMHKGEVIDEAYGGYAKVTNECKFEDATKKDFEQFQQVSQQLAQGPLESVGMGGGAGAGGGGGGSGFLDMVQQGLSKAMEIAQQAMQGGQQPEQPQQQAQQNQLAQTQTPAQQKEQAQKLLLQAVAQSGIPTEYLEQTATAIEKGLNDLFGREVLNVTPIS